ncbi:MAG: hypothetical protein Alpg2KO_05170 [Alphaproteobacteria bacterium]
MLPDVINPWKQRLKTYPTIIVAGYCITLVLWLLSMDQLMDSRQQIFAGDFLAFWSAGRIWCELGFEQVYRDLAQKAMHAHASAAYPNVMRFAYPPFALYLFGGLGALPFVPAAFAFIYGTMTMLGVVLHRILGRVDLTMLFLAAPAALWCVLRGQSSFLLAAVFGIAMLCLPRRQVLAGLAIAVLAIKPQLGLLLPIALLAAGFYRAFAAAAIAVLALIGSTLIVFDLAIWERWLFAADAVGRLVNQNGDFIFPPNLPASIYGTGLMLGTPRLPMLIMHFVVAAIAAGIALWCCWQYRKGKLDWPLAGAVVIAATLLVNPYILIYDLTLLLIPMAILFQHARQDTPLKYEYRSVLLILLLPALTDVIALTTGIQLVSVVIIAALALLMRRILSDLGIRPAIQTDQPWIDFGHPKS